MSKSTKIIAGLGVAAVLGVAALPMASFAAEGDQYTVTVPVQATVANGIKIEVKDNNVASPAWVSATRADNQQDGHAFADLSTISFSLAPGAGTSVLDKTDIRVSTNYPAGYTLSATTTDLEASNLPAIEDFASVSQIATTGNTTSGWGIQVAKDNTVLPAFQTGEEPEVVSGYKGVNSQIDAVTSGITGLTTHTYAVNYGINIAASQAAGTYNGSATFVVASDATLDNTITPVAN